MRGGFRRERIEREYTENLTYEKLMTLLSAHYADDELETLLAQAAALGTQEAIDEGMRAEATSRTSAIRD